MRKILFFILSWTTLAAHSQPIKVITPDRSVVAVTLVDDPTRSQLLKQFNGSQDNSLRKKWTARTYRLSDGRIIVEFYDRQAILVANPSDLTRLQDIRFVKNAIDFLKKNVSYKIELTFEQGNKILKTEKPGRLAQFKSELQGYFDFEVYELSTGQILFIDKAENAPSATIYADIKTLASDNSTVADELYRSEGEDTLMKRLAKGDSLPDYDPRFYLVYPTYLKAIIANHKLTLIEKKVFVTHDFYGNLYRSQNGYYVLIDEINQKNGAGNKMKILTLRIYNTLQEVRDARDKYEKSKDIPPHSEHFYQKISDSYGEKFPALVDGLIDSLPQILNFDKEQLTLDSLGIDLVDEAIKWNWENYSLFDRWFPSVLAYYGQSYITRKKEGQWSLYFDKEYKVWIPVIKLADGSFAFDWRDFYKSLYEGPVPLRSAGNLF